MPHICVSEQGQHWFRLWLVAYSAPSHYLNQCWIIVNWTLRNTLQWSFNQNTNIFIYGNASENIICKMADILSKGNELTMNQHRIGWWFVAKQAVSQYLNQWWPSLLRHRCVTQSRCVNTLRPQQNEWPRFSGWHLCLHFFAKRKVYFGSHFSEVWPHGPKWL